MEAWWLRYPEALVAEKAGLVALGYPWKINEAEFAAGRLVIDVDHQYAGVTRKLVAVYPDSFPYFQPEVFRDGTAFTRHQQPFSRNLCLLARGGDEWRPGLDTLAVLLQEQLPQIQAVNAAEPSSQLVADQEDHVGEPFSSFLPYLPNCVVVVPDETPAVEESMGRLVLQIRPASPDLATPLNVGGVVQTISDLARKPLVEFRSIPPTFSQQISGFWLRLNERPDPSGVSDPEVMKERFFRLLSSSVPAFQKTLSTAKRGQLFVAGFVYKDEVSWRSNSDDWFFLAIRVQLEAKGARQARLEVQFIRADWGGQEAWMRRAPVLRPLRTKSALVIGLGSLGSPLVLHLARAGIGQLSLVDCDELQVGNTVRWALGWNYAGMHKASALSQHLGHEYPYTEVRPHSVRIGSADQRSYQLLRPLCEQSDLIIDSSASHRVSHFLADLARELRKPYLWLTTTHGAAGGVVGRIVPNDTDGCWHCFQHSLADKSIDLPADTGAAEIQPGGCSQPTFIGAGIDSDEIALLAARLAIATLSKGVASGYPDFMKDIFIADLNRDAQSIAPQWKVYDLTVNLSCAACNPK
jgi:molybdopterin/thiamine biosynthesis adenylyltransferase